MPHFLVPGATEDFMRIGEGCYTYIKEIVKGESYIVLGQEEKDALRQAVISYENQNSDG